MVGKCGRWESWVSGGASVDSGSGGRVWRGGSGGRVVIVGVVDECGGWEWWASVDSGSGG